MSVEKLHKLTSSEIANVFMGHRSLDSFPRARTVGRGALAGHTTTYRLPLTLPYYLE